MVMQEHGRVRGQDAQAARHPKVKQNCANVQIEDQIFRAATKLSYLLARHAIDEAAEVAALEVSPPSDLHGSSEYRRDLVRALLPRAVADAGARFDVTGRER